MKMGEEDIIKVFPAVEELSSIRKNVKCPIVDCNMTFPSTSALNMHQLRHHDKQRLAKKPQSQYQYYCPMTSCIYSKDFPNCRHFKQMKCLKQHYLKMHAAKGFLCSLCQKGFPTEAFKTSHEKMCSLIYICSCGYSYNTAEAMRTHLKRKGKDHHAIDPESDETRTKTSAKDKDSILPLMGPNENISSKKGDRLIYPKLGTDTMPFSVQYVAAIALSELSASYNLTPKVTDKGIQTDTLGTSHPKSSKKNTHYVKLCGDRKRKNSQQTQTVAGKCKKLKISAETQTTSEYLKHKKHGSKTPPRKRKQSMETQTREMHMAQQKPLSPGAAKDATLTSFAVQKDAFSGKPNQFLDAESLDEDMFNVTSSLRSKNQSSNFKNEDKDDQNNRTKQWIWESQAFTKTEVVSPESNKKSLLTTINKELFSLNQELNIGSKDKESTDAHNFDINKLCNIETQTEMNPMLLDCNEDTTFTLCSTIETQTTDDFESMLYSNMCTQTCDDADQLFNFIDIETQTAWPELSDYPSL